MQQTLEQMKRKSTLSIFKCHFIIAVVSLLFIGFISGKYWALMAFYGFITISYGFLLYSESIMAARRDFYNANGVKEHIDLFFGFKIGFNAHLLSLGFLVAEIVYYLICLYTNRVDLFNDYLLRFWMMHFFGFFPKAGTYQWLTFAIYLLASLFPCIVCGISYYYGIKQCKTKRDEETGFTSKKYPTDNEKHLL